MPVFILAFDSSHLLLFYMPKLIPDTRAGDFCSFNRIFAIRAKSGHMPDKKYLMPSTINSIC